MKPGQIFIAKNQGMNITPYEIKITVVWDDGDNIHYTKENDPTVYQTTKERFKEITD